MKQHQTTADKLDYPVLINNFINSIIEKSKEYIEDDFRHSICWFLDGDFKVSNAVILDYPNQTKLDFYKLLKTILKNNKALAYIIIKRGTSEDKILRTEEENLAIPKTINNNYTLDIHSSYKVIIKDALILNFASKKEKMIITIPYTKQYEKVTLENFKEEKAKGGIIFNLLV